MMGHKICFSGEIWPIIPKLSLLLLLIWSPDPDEAAYNELPYFFGYKREFFSSKGVKKSRSVL